MNILPVFVGQDYGRRCGAKVRGAILPPESELSRLLNNVSRADITWQSDVSACSWKGVLCDKLDNVVSIFWWGMNLHGTFAWAYLPRTLQYGYFGEQKEAHEVRRNQLQGNNLDLENLPNAIKKFDVSGNQLTGTLDISNLPATLDGLWAYNNQFYGKINLLSLPSGLRTIDLHGNNLTGSLDFTSLPDSMVSLRLQGNHFQGEIDFQFLPKGLKKLDLSGNSFDKGDLVGAPTFSKI